jgi:hypothetical protein
MIDKITEQPFCQTRVMCQKGVGRIMAHNGWVFAKLPLQILQIKHKC